MKTIQVRKPSKLRWYAKFIIGAYARYNTKLFEWRNSLPNNGDKIQITWFPDNFGVTNAYIGWTGVVENMNKEEGTFVLNSGNALLICHGNFDYVKV